MDHSVRPVEGQAPDVGATDADGRGTEGERLDDVRPGTDPRIKQHWCFAGRFYDRR